MTHTTTSHTPVPVAIVTTQSLTQWQALLQQTMIQSHLGNIMTLPRWAEVSQPWKAS